MKHKEALVGIPLLVTLALVAGIWIGYSFIPSDSRSGHPEAKVGEILDIISENYVDQVDLDSLIETTIPSMLENLDPHTAYIPAADLDEVNADLEGSFSGIGISFQVMNDTITVVEIISGGPSEKVGLMAGDRIVEVNDSTVAGTDITPDQVRALLRGAAGTQVKLGVMRNTSPDMLTYTVTRGDIPVTSIDASYMIEDRIGYIKVNKFGRNTYEEFYTEMLMLDRAGAKDIILDLRGNGGGFLDVAIRMANEFLNRDNLIVMTKGRDGELLFAAKSDGSGSFRNDRVVILIDEFSASASEIMAGAIQDNDRGIIIGRRSFGKGLVQQQINLADSSAMRVTTARYYTPSGRCIQKPWEKGHNDRYATEIYERYLAGEAFSADSVKFDARCCFPPPPADRSTAAAESCPTYSCRRTPQTIRSISHRWSMQAFFTGLRLNTPTATAANWTRQPTRTNFCAYCRRIRNFCRSSWHTPQATECPHGGITSTFRALCLLIN